jgi:wyosine [tRNA(Phe)-imidazoG37] synthetase (radical SAM superfamily)
MTGDMAQARIQVAYRHHERRWRDNRYVYAVVSRRSRGISIGINLNPDKACNFDCIYCQVNRKEPPQVRKVQLDKLREELDRVLEAERDGSLYSHPPFDLLALERRGVRDIAFSGDGEPTIYPRFEEAVRIAADTKSRFGLGSTKLVLITDAAYLAKPSIRKALKLMDANNGEIWAKLDAGTEEYFHLVDRPNVTLERILANILDAAQLRPVVIQSLWLHNHGDLPSQSEIRAYCARLNELLRAGAQIKAVQLYTIARDPTESYAVALSDGELDAIATIVKALVPVPIEIHYGVRPTEADAH